MPRLVYLTSARRDLAKIAIDIEDTSHSRKAALAFPERLTDYCERLASLPGLLGRPRYDLRPEYRSFTFGSYVAFFRYVDGAVPRETLEVIHSCMARATWTPSSNARMATASPSNAPYSGSPALRSAPTIFSRYDGSKHHIR